MQTKYFGRSIIGGGTGLAVVLEGAVSVRFSILIICSGSLLEGCCALSAGFGGLSRGSPHLTRGLVRLSANS